MLNCEKCHVHIATQTDQCPLCHQPLPGYPDPDLDLSFPAYSPLIRPSSLRTKSLLLSAAIFGLMLAIIFWTQLALAYLMPSIISCLIIALNIRLIISQKIRDSFKVLFSLCLLGLIPLFLAIFKIIQPIYPSAITAGLSFLTLTGLFVAAKKTVLTELKKIFHL